jgi:hypothetical protein
MRLWELVIRDDRRTDLADPVNGREWLGQQPWWGWGGFGGPWRTEIARDWTAVIGSLRSVVRRLGYTRNTREPGVEPRTADRIAGAYVGLLQLYLHRLGSTEGAGLTRRTFGGMRVRPTQATRSSLEGDLNHFFQRVFGSLFVPDIEPVCGTCGRDLPLTAGGKPSRRTTCKACQQRASFGRKSAKEKREVWRKQYTTKTKRS